MSQSSGLRPTIWCRWAERMPDGLMNFWVRKHKGKCDYCQSEQATWEEVLAELRQMRSQTAPPSLLSDVMAQIAQERAEGVLADQTFPKHGNTGLGSSRQLVPDQISLFVFLGSWLLIILTVPQLVDQLSLVAGGSLATMRDTGDVVVQTSRSIFSGIGVSTMGPLFLGIVWSGIGWVITLAVRAFAYRVTMSRSE